MWELSSTSFTKLTIDQLTETCLIANPDVAVARAGVIHYFTVCMGGWTNIDTAAAV